jgi:hypothetical protein
MALLFIISFSALRFLSPNNRVHSSSTHLWGWTQSSIARAQCQILISNNILGHVTVVVVTIIASLGTYRRFTAMHDLPRLAMEETWGEKVKTQKNVYNKYST